MATCRAHFLPWLQKFSLAAWRRKSAKSIQPIGNKQAFGLITHRVSANIRHFRANFVVAMRLYLLHVILNIWRRNRKIKKPSAALLLLLLLFPAIPLKPPSNWGDSPFRSRVWNALSCFKTIVRQTCPPCIVNSLQLFQIPASRRGGGGGLQLGRGGLPGEGGGRPGDRPHPRPQVAVSPYQHSRVSLQGRRARWDKITPCCCPIEGKLNSFCQFFFI